MRPCRCHPNFSSNSHTNGAPRSLSHIHAYPHPISCLRTYPHSLSCLRTYPHSLSRLRTYPHPRAYSYDGAYSDSDPIAPDGCRHASAHCRSTAHP